MVRQLFHMFHCYISDLIVTFNPFVVLKKLLFYYCHLENHLDVESIIELLEVNTTLTELTLSGE